MEETTSNEPIIDTNSPFLRFFILVNEDISTCFLGKKYNKSSGVLIPKLFRIRIFFDPILFMDSKLVLIKYFFEFILDDLCIHILNL